MTAFDIESIFVVHIGIDVCSTMMMMMRGSRIVHRGGKSMVRNAAIVVAATALSLLRRDQHNFLHLIKLSFECVDCIVACWKGNGMESMMMMGSGCGRNHASIAIRVINGDGNCIGIGGEPDDSGGAAETF